MDRPSGVTIACGVLLLLVALWMIVDPKRACRVAVRWNNAPSLFLFGTEIQIVDEARCVHGTRLCGLIAGGLLVWVLMGLIRS